VTYTTPVQGTISKARSGCLCGSMQAINFFIFLFFFFFSSFFFFFLKGVQNTEFVLPPHAHLHTCEVPMNRQSTLSNVVYRQIVFKVSSTSGRSSVDRLFDILARNAAHWFSMGTHTLRGRLARIKGYRPLNAALLCHLNSYYHVKPSLHTHNTQTCTHTLRITCM